ncbi:MAG: ABC transporter permease, partial [Candidatus Methanoplasma sp.]|nr:ABC transporter permease [Candidatus Methanoplasma sp.]
DLTSPSTIGLINGDNGAWSDFAVESIDNFYVSTYGIEIEDVSDYIVKLESPYGDTEKITQEMIDKGLTVAFGIEPGFTDNINNKVQSSIREYYIFQSSGLMESASSTVSSTIVGHISSSISLKLVSEMTGDDSSVFLLNPIKTNAPYTYVKGEVYEGVTPMLISSTMMTQTMMIPMIVMIVIVMIGSIVISSMGNEKENKTLETLLTMPVNRTSIVSGKLLAAAIMGLVYGIAYMIGMSFYVNGIAGAAGGVNLSDYNLGLEMTDWILIGVMIFLGIFCALGICMIMGAFAKNNKTAQTMTLPISILAMIPMFITMFSSWNSLPLFLQAVVFAIPFSHPMMVMNNLMMGDTTLVLTGLIYLLIFTVITIFVTVRIYKSDILLTGLGQTKAAKFAKTMVTKKR